MTSIIKRSAQLLLVLSGLILSACSEPKTETTHNSQAAHNMSNTAGQNGRWYSAEQVSQGKKLFQQYCAECHGAFAQGNPNWRQPTENGRYLPPPLNGTGHAWHHPMAQLRDVITNGRGPDVPSDMPAWGEKVNAQEVDALIAWFQSRWPDEIYQAWSRPKH
ncbi:Cytochrome C oxidase, cbb3-type, subunit III [Oceanospirillum multiglobuliferum]|uniref:Cytochrome c domain-containing protein n=2 Tax=Oceanospirillum multiglobuliferum TaxID=64969 RepID=A0A1T4PPC2_9GAMM|nr:hypothetical protein BTE48_09475 [Oceanospirillum multiglobuliferum]SJZ93382.1 Cytochrome C oxidase, cbb3-type, subunit III [Oceanospirillum multiglobuliferum]